MSQKSWIWLGFFIGSSIGGYVPVLFGVDIFSGWSLFGNTIGAIIGIYIGYKFAQNNSSD